jgi:hypothetical protein
MPSPTVTPLAYWPRVICPEVRAVGIVRSPTQTPARLVVLSPTPVDGLVLSPTFCCGWACAITHKPIVLSPTTTKKNTLKINDISHFSRGVTRARFFNLLNSLTSLRPKGRGTPAGFPHPSGGSPSLYRGPRKRGRNSAPGRSTTAQATNTGRGWPRSKNRLSKKDRRRPAR